MRSLNEAPWVVQAGREGRVFACHWGTVTTPIATPATTAITARRPQAWIRIPTGTVIVPLDGHIVVESTGITTQGEIALSTTTNDVGNGTSSAGTSGALNTNPGSTNTSNVTQRQLATADVTLETGLIEYDRFSFAASAVNQHFHITSFQEVPPFLRGPASLLLYIGGNAVNFYATLQWVEYPEDAQG